MAAASWLGRYRRSVLVVDSGDYRAAAVDRSHGYLGRDPQHPIDLLDHGRREVLAYPTVQICSGRVLSLRRREDQRFDLTVSSAPARKGLATRDRGPNGQGPRGQLAGTSQSLVAHRVLLACGVKDTLPDIPGFADHYGASVFHCPACDGYEARERHVVAYGWEPHLVGFASTLLNWAGSVTVVTGGRRFEGEESYRETLKHHAIPLLERNVVQLVGDRGALEGVRLDDGQLIPASIMFFSIAHMPQTALAESAGCTLDDEGYVVVDHNGQSSVPGVYAAGDLVPGLQLVQVAAGSGAVAGVGCAQSFFGQPGAGSSPTPAPDSIPGQGG